MEFDPSSAVLVDSPETSGAGFDPSSAVMVEESPGLVARTKDVLKKYWGAGNDIKAPAGVTDATFSSGVPDIPGAPETIKAPGSVMDGYSPSAPRAPSVSTKAQQTIANEAIGSAPATSIYGNRLDGTPKGDGWLGPLKRPDGKVSSELSIGVNLNGKQTEIPMLVPTLSKNEVDYLLSNGKPTRQIVDKAVAHAREQISAGKSPFKEYVPGASPQMTEDVGFRDLAPGARAVSDRANIEALAKATARRTGALPEVARNIAVSSYGAAGGDMQDAQAAAFGTGSADNSSFDFTTAKEMKGAGQVERGLKKGALLLGNQALGVHKFLADTVGAEDYSQAMSAGRKENSRAVEAIGERSGHLTRNFEGALQSIVSNAPGLIFGVATGTEAIPLAIMGAQVFGDEYSNGAEKGRGYAESTARAGLFAAAEIIGEKLAIGDSIKAFRALKGLGSLSNKEVADEFAKHIIKSSLKEIPGEELTMTLQFLADKIPGFGHRPEASLSDYLQEAGDTFTTTIMQSAMMAGGGRAAIAAHKHLSGDAPASQAPLAQPSGQTSPPAPLSDVPPGAPVPTLAAAQPTPVASVPAPTQSASRAMPPAAPDESMQFADLAGDKAPIAPPADAVSAPVKDTAVPAPAAPDVATPVEDVIQQAYGDNQVITDLIQSNGAGLGLGSLGETLTRVAPKVAAVKAIVASQRARAEQGAIEAAVDEVRVDAGQSVDAQAQELELPPPGELSLLQRDIAKIKARRFVAQQQAAQPGAPVQEGTAPQESAQPALDGQESAQPVAKTAPVPKTAIGREARALRQKIDAKKAAAAQAQTAPSQGGQNAVDSVLPAPPETGSESKTEPAVARTAVAEEKAEAPGVAGGPAPSAIRGYPKGRATTLAANLTKKGLLTEAYPHPSGDGTYALRIPGVNQKEGSISGPTKAVSVEAESMAAAEAPAAAVANPAPEIDQAAHEAATSPRNDLPEPSGAQKKAGNYKVGKISISGLNISIENPEGSVRSGTDPNGKSWSNKLRSHYGYLLGTEGNDGDHVDVFVKPGTPEDYSGNVFVIDQKKGNGHFDEHKVMIGWNTQDGAVVAYKANYAKGWDGVRAVSPMRMDQFKQWLSEGDHKQPAATWGKEKTAVQKDIEKIKARKASEFVKAPDGSVDFGEIAPDMAKAMKRQAGKIRLERGDDTYGMKHIESRRGALIQSMGFESVESFVSDAVKHIDSVWRPSKTSQLVVIQAEENGKAVFIELKPSDNGDYYTVNTAFPVSDNYAEKKKGWGLLWSGASVPTVASGANPLAEPPPNAGVTTTMTPGQSSESTVSPNPEKINEPTAKISDFGAKIGGAKKDLWATYDHKMKQAEGLDVSAEPLSKSWPEPDYQGLIDAGADPFAVAFMRASREAIPRKPAAGWKLKGWVAGVTIMRDTSAKLLTGELSVPAASAKLAEAAKTSRGMQDVSGRIELYQLVGHGQSLSGVKLSSGEYSLYKGVEHKPPKVLWTISKSDSESRFSNWPRELVVADSKEDALRQFKEKFDSLVITKPKEVAASFDIFSQGGASGFFIGKKVGRNIVTLAGPLDTIKEARAYREENHAELVAKLEKSKEIPKVRRESNEPRVGEDMRDGQDVTVERFADSFGFKGVEFGNWVEQKKRQKDLNEAFDALMDMAAILGVPPKALSLNGELGLAFGARGAGGIDPAVAHYEPDYVAINLTKKEGAGSLGHEWWHALDNYFSRMRGKGADNMSEASDVSLASRQAKYFHQGAVRKEMVDAFGLVIGAIRSTALKERSAKLDSKRSKEYWTTSREMSARAFESYLISKLQDQNASNDYLANIVDPATWKAAESLGFELDDSYPYPTAGEVPVIRAAFDKFFSAVETKEEDGRVAVFSRNKNPADGGLSTRGLQSPKAVQGSNSGADNVAPTDADVNAQLSRGTASEQSIAAADLGAVVATYRKGFPGVPVVTVEHESQLPDALQQEINEADAGGEVAGAFHRGSVYLVRDNLRSIEHAEDTVMHEAEHAGLRNLFGASLDPVMLDVWKNNLKVQLAAKKIKDKYGYSQVRAIEEVLAEMGPGAKSLKGWPALVSWVRAKLRKMGFVKEWTDQDVEALVLRALASLKDKGATSLYSGTALSRSENGGLNFVNEFLAELSYEDAAFRYPVSKSLTLEGNIAEALPGSEFLGEDTRPDEREESLADHRFVFSMPSKKRFYVYTKGKEVWIDISRLNPGDQGGAVYHGIANYAHNAGKVFVGDPHGLSEEAIVRRTSAMLSSALRFGTVAHFDAARQQIVGVPEKGIEPLDWRGDDVAKTKALIHTFIATLHNQFPAIKDYRYDAGRNRFVDQRGRSLDSERLDRGAGSAVARASRAGEASLRRGILIQSLASSESGERPGLLELVLSRSVQLTGSKNGLKAVFSRQEPGGTDSEARFSRIIGDSGRQYTADQQSMFKTTGREVDPATTIAKIKKWAGTNWVQGVFDQFEPIKHIDRHAYVLTRLSRGASGAFEAFMKNGKLSLKNGVYDADTSGGVLREVFFPIGKETTDFLYWIAGNRAERLAAEGKERLFSVADIASAKSLADGKTDFDYLLPSGQVTRDRPEIYKDSLRKFNEFNKNVMDIAEQSGLIDGLSRHMWEHEFYVPFYRTMSEKDGDFRGMSIKQGVVRQTAFKQLKGGKEGLNDLLANTLMNWAHLIDASAKNRAAKATIEASLPMGIVHKAAAGEKNTVWYMDGGKKMEFGVDDPELLTALNGLDFTGIKGWAMDIMSTTKNVLTVGVTASPFFKVRNLIRDSVQAVAASGLSYNVAGNLINGYKLTKHDRPEYVSALAGGALIRFGTMLEGNEAGRTRQLIKKGAKDEHILDSESKIRRFYDKYLEPGIAAYNEIGNRGEEINRMSLYDQLIKQGVSHAEASFQARDLMDFSAKGSFTAVRFLTQIVPFMNARLQGMYKLGVAAKQEKAKFAIVTGAVALVSIALAAAYRDDDDWNKREEWDRDNYWWFKFGGTAFRIPKPFEIGAIGTLAERSFELMFNKEMTGERFGKSVRKLIADQLAMNPLPQLFKPILDIYSNRDSFTGRDIESMSMERVDPEYRFNANTSLPARGMSKAVGGTLSPVQIDHLVRGYFGWLGATSVATADLIVRYATDEKDRPTMDYWKLATGGIISDKDSAGSRYVSAMYDQAREIESAYATYNMINKNEGEKAAAKYKEENASLVSRYGEVEGVKKDVSAESKEIHDIERADLAGGVKRYKINQLRKKQSDQARKLFPAN